MSRAAVRVLCIAGLEPSGRAGLFADLHTVAQLGAHPLGIASALTAQGTSTFGSTPSPISAVEQQLRALVELGRIDAVKLGMIPSSRMLRAIQVALREVGCPWVVDPVVQTSRGEPLSSLRPEDYLRLAQPAVVVTPNAPELKWLTRSLVTVPRNATLRTRARALLREGFGGVVVKGGHLRGHPVDHVFSSDGEWHLPGRRVKRTTAHRGTGCRFAAALGVGLAAGLPIDGAAAQAKAEVEKFLAAPILRGRLHGRAA